MADHEAGREDTERLLGKIARAGGIEGLTPDERALYDELEEAARRAFASVTPQQWRDVGEGLLLFKSLPPSAQERFGDWTPRQLLTMRGLLEETGTFQRRASDQVVDREAQSMGIAPRLMELRALSDEELAAHHDAAAEHTQVGLGYYLEELARRRLDRQTETMLGYTNAVRRLTVAIATLAAVTAAVGIATLIVTAA